MVISDGVFLNEIGIDVSKSDLTVPFCPWDIASKQLALALSLLICIINHSCECIKTRHIKEQVLREEWDHERSEDYKIGLVPCSDVES